MERAEQRSEGGAGPTATDTGRSTAAADTARIHPTHEPLRAVAARTPWLMILIGWVVAYATGAVLALAVKALGWWQAAHCACANSACPRSTCGSSALRRAAGASVA